MSHFDKVQGFSQEFMMYHEDVELCHKIKKNLNLNTYLIMGPKIIHLEGASVSIGQKSSKKYQHYIKSSFVYQNLQYRGIYKLINKIYFSMIFIANIFLNGLSFRRIFEFKISDKLKLIKLVLKELFSFKKPFS